ncbi:uncharacterized protein LOC129217326 [Uloborus diversus]|uniref:uncharacterized protein LOC129217326 n=1 Tax=Uloborus diversus TaxID=327109 RepID=UPI002409ACFF|nr:uncharacterized protein LOC129217326 [Uloborus diversus]
MEDRYFKGYLRDPARCQLLLQGRFAGFVMAVPFVLCFSLFGIFNLVGGTVLTIMSCKPKISPKGMIFLQKLFQNTKLDFQNQLDPMQVVGIILLLTGSLLVVVGVTLGIVACKSVDERHRRRCKSTMSSSGFPFSSTTERSSRRASSITSSAFPNIRAIKGDRKRSHTETISPIMEVNSEEENVDNEEYGAGRSFLHSRTELHDISPTLSTQEICISPKQTHVQRWETKTGCTSVQIVAEVQHIHPNETLMTSRTEKS